MSNRNRTKILVVTATVSLASLVLMTVVKQNTKSFPTPEDFFKWRDECKAELGLSKNDSLPVERMTECTKALSEAAPSVRHFIETADRALKTGEVK